MGMFYDHDYPEDNKQPSKEAQDYFRGYQTGYLKGSEAGLRVFINSQVKAPASGTLQGYEYVSVGEASARLFHHRETLMGLLNQVRQQDEYIKELEQKTGTSRTGNQGAAKCGCGMARCEVDNATKRQYDHADPWNPMGPWDDQ